VALYAMLCLSDRLVCSSLCSVHLFNFQIAVMRVFRSFNSGAHERVLKRLEVHYLRIMELQQLNIF